ncbi:hypothetical protein GCM10011578_094500 [Streptomyces fuscichromogenes]|uniref:FMN-dependent dehydrogenase domain-containing protein n=1 Tax=Streptomyces fuscichromogenes TaxID=1324013 RepID=A0A918CXF2_9ACTN|nr:hypothetical protein GCM10011578_094500 [Streptomyces fuscichromogenes]
MEEVGEAQPDLFFQLCWSGTRATMVRRMDRARAACAKALIVTLDWSFSHGRDRGSPAVPDRLDLRTMLRFAPKCCPEPPGCGGRVRRATAIAAVADIALEHRRDQATPDPVRYGVARRLDDLAYRAGVWFSALGAARPPPCGPVSRADVHVSRSAESRGRGPVRCPDTGATPPRARDQSPGGVRSDA